MKPEDRKVIAAFRRSAYAPKLRDILREALADARAANEDTNGTAQTHAVVADTKAVMVLLFGDAT